jgi:hypothetical protein
VSVAASDAGVGCDGLQRPCTNEGHVSAGIASPGAHAPCSAKGP